MNPSLETTQANVYHLLARAFSSPLEMDEEQPRKLLDLASQLPASLQKPGRTLAEAWDDALANRETLSLAYARLFLGPFEIQAPPYASFYLERNQRLMGDISQQVAQFYVDAGLGPGSGPHEAPDHVALEWEFMYFLTYQHVTTGEDHWADRRRAFYTTHLQYWMPVFTENILQSGEHAFYHALAVFLSAFLKELQGA